MRIHIIVLACSLAMSLAAGCDGMDEEQFTLSIQGSNSVGPLATRISEAYMAEHPDAVFTLNVTNSGDGITAIGTDMTDLGMSSRPLNSEELMMYPGLVPIAIARDAIGVFVHPSNDLTTLTLEQLADVYAGRVTNFNQIGGADQPLVPYAREAGSGTRDFFEGVVLGDDVFGSNVMDRDGNAAVRDAVALDRSGIGFASFGILDTSVVTLSLDAGAGAVTPTRERISDETYPITRPLLLIEPPEPSLSADLFVDYALSPSAQAIADQLGYVSVL